jgi:sortase A
VATGVSADSGILRILVKSRSARRTLRWAQVGLFSAAILMLGYCGFVLVDTWIFQVRESVALEQFVPTNNTSTPLTRKSVIREEGLIGRIEVSRLGVSAVVMEGTTDKTLRHAVGHIDGTALPGEPGNVGIAGHRDTFFRPLRNIHRDDLITLTTSRGEYRYRVLSTKVVSPDRVDVLNSDGDEILTLVTCYPFYFVGPAPSRFIVRAARMS